MQQLYGVLVDRGGRHDVPLPSAERITMSDTPSLQNWSSDTGQVVVQAAFAYGRIWVAMGSFVHAYDQMTGINLKRYGPFGDYADPRLIAQYGPTVGVACDDGSMYSIDPFTDAIAHVADVGDLIWMEPHNGSLLVAGDRGIYRVAPLSEGVHTPNGPLIGPFSPGYLTARPALANDLIFVSSNAAVGQIIAIDTKTLTDVKWTTNIGESPLKGLYVHGNRLAAVVEDSAFVIDYRSGETLISTQLPFGGKPITEPLLDSRYLYVTLDTDVLMSIDLLSGSQVTIHMLPGTPSERPILTEDGIVFYAGPREIFIVDASAGTAAGVEIYETGGNPVLVAHEDGALIYADDQNLVSARLDDEVHDFYVEANLIQDFEFGDDSSGPSSSTPNFQIDLTLQKNDGTPRANRGFVVTPTKDTRIGYQGQVFSAAPWKPVFMETDGAGRARFSVLAALPDDSNAFKPSLTAPELHISAPFLDPNLQYVVRPDGNLRQNLSSITADELANAKGYNGSLVIKSEFRNDPERLGVAATTINKASGLISRTDVGVKHSAFNSPDPQTAFVQRAADGATSLSIDSPFHFDLRKGQSIFRDLTADEAEAMLRGREVSPKESVSSFWNDVVTGEAAVLSAAITGVTTGANAVLVYTVAGVEKTVKLVIDTLQQASLLVQGIFNAIAETIEQVIEAVSFVFDWNAILGVQQKIVSNVKSGWELLNTPGNDFSFDAMKSTVNAWFSEGKHDWDSVLDKMVTMLGTRTSMGAQTEASGKPNASAGAVQDNWMASKMQDNMVGGVATAGYTPPRGVNQPSGVSLPTFEPSVGVRDAFDGFVAALEDKVTNDIQMAKDRVRADLDFNGDPGVAARTLASLIEIVRGLGDIALDVTETLIELIIDLVASISQAALVTMNSPVTIPFLSELWRWITDGEEFTLLNMFALVLAIPTGFAIGALSREPAYASGVVAAKPTAESRAAAAEKLVSDAAFVEIAAGVTQVAGGVLGAIFSSINAVIENAGYPDKKLPPFHWIMVVRTIVKVSFLVVGRGLFLMALALKQPPALIFAQSVLIWLIPSMMIVVDIGTIVFGNINPDLNALVVVAAGISSALMLALGAYVAVELASVGANAWMSAAVTGCVAIALLARVVPLSVYPATRFAGFALIGFLISISGILEIEQGVLEGSGSLT